MKYASVLSYCADGFNHYPVRVETDISRGLFTFSIVGLGDKAISESKDRIISAIKHSGFESPKTKGSKIVVSLSPAYSKKQGSRFDLVIAVSYLLATQEIVLSTKHFPVTKCYFIGELGLNGDILPVPDIVKSILDCPDNAIVFISSRQLDHIKILFSVVKNKKIYAVKNLHETAQILGGKIRAVAFGKKTYTGPTKEKYPAHIIQKESLWASIQNQDRAKRVAKIGVAGGHHIVIFGPPGSGKSMLAESCKEIMPTLSLEKQIEVLSNIDSNSISGLDSQKDSTNIACGPFRKVSSTISNQALIGGGNSFRAGEVTLAHNGILFIDELLEMKKETIEKLREPLECKSISIKKSLYRACIPANFQMIATANLCPCGHIGSQRKKCVCRLGEIINYQKRVSGAISDRIDLWVKINESREEDQTYNSDTDNQTAEKERAYINACRDIQQKRQGKLNSELDPEDVIKIITSLSKECREIIKKSESMLSQRGTHRLIKVARTIADIEKSSEILTIHIIEALSYRKESYINTFQN